MGVTGLCRLPLTAQRDGRQAHVCDVRLLGKCLQRATHQGGSKTAQWERPASDPGHLQGSFVGVDGLLDGKSDPLPVRRSAPGGRGSRMPPTSRRTCRTPR